MTGSPISKPALAGDWLGMATFALAHGERALQSQHLGVWLHPEAWLIVNREISAHRRRLAEP